MSILKAGWIQSKSQEDLNKNLKYYTDKIKEAAKSNARLIVLPELFLWNYFPRTEDKKNFDLAIKIDSNKTFSASCKRIQDCFGFTNI